MIQGMMSGHDTGGAVYIRPGRALAQMGRAEPVRIKADGKCDNHANSGV